MGLIESAAAMLNRIAAPEQKSAPALPDWGAELIFAAPSISGPAVTPQTAMRSTAVSCAVQLISKSVGTLPVKLFRRDGKGGKTAATDHPAHKLLHGEANPWTSSEGLRQQLTADALLHGNGYAYANRVNGQVLEFIRLDPTTVQAKTSATGEPVYLSGSGRDQRTLSYRDVLHVPAFSLDGLTGVSPIHLAREAIGLALTYEQHAARLFSRGGRPSGVLSFPNKLGEDVAKRVSTSWHAAHSGEQTGKTAVLEDGGQFQPLQFTSVDAQFIESRRLQIEEIARAFNVPATMLFELSNGTLANTEQMGQTFLTYTLRSWLSTWVWAYTRVLLEPGAERDELLIEFVTDDLLTVEFAARATAYQAYRSMGAITANEVRAGLNKPARPDGDDLASPYTTSNTTSTNQADTPAEGDAA
ncbi:phage portal protein [Devosia sp. A449]